MDITVERLLEQGFKVDNNGNYWINLQTHYLELIQMPDGYYPVICQVPELSSEEEQRVSLKRIHTMEGLGKIISIIE